MFGWEFPPHISGGLGTACYGLTKGLLTNEVEVIFVVPKIFGDEEPGKMRLINASDVAYEFSETSFQETWNKMTFIGVNSSLRPYLSPEEFQHITTHSNPDRTETAQKVSRTKFEFSGQYGKDLFTEVARYALIGGQIALSNQFDIIHAHDWLTFPAGILAKKKSGKPLVAHVHATEFDRSGENINREVYDIEREGVHAADKVITVSNLTREIVINRYDVDPQKVVAIHNGVLPKDKAPPVYQKSQKEKIVTFLGRVTFQKGPEYFVEAANKILKKDHNVRFVMAGNGDMWHNIIKRVAKLGIASRFNFTGFLKGDEVDQMFAMSDVYVMPSVSEPFGISPLEALRSDVPVIISRQSGVSETLRHALKVDFWDTDALADAIYGLLQYKTLSDMSVRLGKKEVVNLNWDKTAFKVKQVYQQILN